MQQTRRGPKRSHRVLAAVNRPEARSQAKSEATAPGISSSTSPANPLSTAEVGHFLPGNTGFSAKLFAWILVAIACGVLTFGSQAEEVPDWEDDEIAFSIVVLAPAVEVTEEVPDWEDDEVAILEVELTRMATGDLDVFSFVLTHQTTVRLETRGEMDTFGQLMDEAGLDLASDDNSGVDTNFRIVKTLSPGRYFLGVGSAEGSTGPYVLTASLSKPQGGDI